MNTYIKNKILSLVVPLSAILITLWWYGDTPQQWTLLLMLVMTLGYTHFAVGGYYQLRGFARQKQARYLYGFFILLVGLSALAIGMADAYKLMPLVAFLVIPYFMVHGYYNEKNLFTRQVSNTVPTVIIFGIAAWATAATIYAFGHPSAFFTPQLTFLSSIEVTQILSFTKALFFWGSYLSSFVLALGVLTVLVYGLLTRRRYQKIMLLQLLVTSLATMYMYYHGPFNYIYLFTVLLGYHFMTWLIYFGVLFYSSEPQRFRHYVFLHLSIIVVVILLAGSSRFTHIIFNGNFFLFLTLAHITTSFMNDDWFKTAIAKLTR